MENVINGDKLNKRVNCFSLSTKNLHKIKRLYELFYFFNINYFNVFHIVWITAFYAQLAILFVLVTQIQKKVTLSKLNAYL